MTRLTNFQARGGDQVCGSGVACGSIANDAVRRQPNGHLHLYEEAQALWRSCAELKTISGMLSLLGQSTPDIQARAC